MFYVIYWFIVFPKIQAFWGTIGVESPNKEKA